jgi:RNA 2',3'-cyclic 3'-phosphodiesterase
MLRLFVALALPDLVKTQLAALAGGMPGAKWISPENYHLTLRFIGEIESWRAEEVDAALAAIRAPRFDLALAGVGSFEKGGRILSLNVPALRSEALARLQGKVETALQRIGLEPERRRFTPHVTLARTDKAETHKVVSFLQVHALFRPPPVPVEHFTLFSSHLGKESAHYVPEVEYELA